MPIRFAKCLAPLVAVVVPVLLPAPADAEERLVTLERFVPHTSTVPANKGQRVGLYVREKAGDEAIAGFESGAAPEGRVVLFVHGGSVLGALVSGVADHYWFNLAYPHMTVLLWLFIGLTVSVIQIERENARRAAMPTP